MKKRILTCVLTFVMAAVCCIPVHAEGEDYSNTDYWNNLCTGGQSLTSEQKSECTAYIQYMSSQSSSLQEQIDEINSQKEEIAANIQVYTEKIKNYQSQADALNTEIADLNKQISVKEKEIETKQAEIDDKQAQIDSIEQKLKDRMVSQQSTMRLNQYLDILMGAKSFNDLIRIINGLSDITNYDQDTWDSLSDLIDQLNSDKADLESAKTELDTQKQTVLDKQNSLLALKYQAQVVEEQYQQQAAELEAEGNKIAGDIEAIQAQMKSISAALGEVATTAGWTYPVSGAYISAGTWAYSGGGLHLGEDFAASKGTNVYAVGNGVVINRADGCGDGYLGSTCGPPSGSSGGGNQVYLLTKINGGLYAIKYLHLLAGTPIAVGTIVSAGDVIGQVGTSGNSTGPHCHIEVFYLGSADNFSSYVSSWSGDLAFGCGWGPQALNRLCENGVSAPCRLRPESVFGG